jgi:hypothetical protein
LARTKNPPPYVELNKYNKKPILIIWAINIQEKHQKNTNTKNPCEREKKIKKELSPSSTPQ